MMKQLMQFLCIILAVSAAALTDTEPTPWAKSFFASLLRNGTSPDDGSSTGYDVQMKYYDYTNADLPVYKQECSRNGITATFLLRGQTGYIFNTVAEACQKSTLPVAVVKPDWMQGGEYQGQEVVNNVLSNKWMKQDHLYYESVSSPKRPTRVYTPFDQRGIAHQEDYGTYQIVSHAPSVFAVPDFCKDAQTVDVTRPSRRQSISDSSSDSPLSAKAADPQGCFV